MSCDRLGADGPSKVDEFIIDHGAGSRRWIEGSQLTFPPRHSSFKGGIKLKLNLVKPKCAPLRMYSPRFQAASFRTSRLSYGARVRSCQVTSFKGNEENKSEDESSITKFTKNRLQIYFSRHGDMTLADFPKLLDGAVSYAVVAANKTASRSQAVHRLFSKWIKQHTERPNESGEAIVEGPSQTELVQAQTGTHMEERSNVLMLALRYFLELDATIKVPLLIFVPFFLAVTLIHGMEVSKALTRLWIIGPLIAALYTRIVQKIISLYIFSIRLPISICRNVSERLTEAVLLCFTKIKSFNPMEITIRKWEEFKETVEESIDVAILAICLTRENGMKCNVSSNATWLSFHVKTHALASRFYSKTQCSKMAPRKTGTGPGHDKVVGVEIVHGTEECRRRSLELLEELGFPKQVLPLKDLEECGRVHSTGFVWMKQNAATEHYFKKTKALVSYARR
ncbi:hypothetical protein AKJ16_DCAP19242 [Drosera capensis]